MPLDVLAYLLGRYGETVVRLGVDCSGWPMFHLVRFFDIGLWSTFEDTWQTFVGV